MCVDGWRAGERGESMMTMSVAHAVAESLRRLGVERVYGLIGIPILDFIDALYDYRDSIRFITTRHKQVAFSMADAEDRLTGQRVLRL